MALNLENYKYHLPEERIAQHPLKDRSSSKLLVYHQGSINHENFRNIADQLPDNCRLVFNDTRVIPARLFFTRATGALIEIFLLEPLKPYHQREKAMECTVPVQWKCMIRNLKKWKEDTLSFEIPDLSLKLNADLIDRENQIVELSWNDKNISFAEVLENAGKIPLPPYVKREATKEDAITYQTVYAKQKGAVAAPTAGLHFTEEIVKQLKEKGIRYDYLTLHVSAGTFQPIKEENVKDHVMHDEEVVIKKENLKFLLENEGDIIPVGTTSMRTLESLYWYGVKLIEEPDASFHIPQNFAYEDHPVIPSREEALAKVLELMERLNVEQLIGNTEIFILPGYTFRVCDGLITNFHLPGSTLILLVAALVGDDWKRIYKEAITNNYRFLSYGDSSLLLPKT